MFNRRRTLLLLLLLLLLLGRVEPVAAHTELERAEPPPDVVLPTAPPSLRLFMTETIEPGFTEVVVLDAARRPLTRARPQVSPDQLVVTLDLPPLPEGAYTVTWKATSTVDGHTTRGFYPLTIGQAGAAAGAGAAPAVVAPAGPPVPYQAAVRWLAFAGQALLVGGLLFGPLVLAPAFATAGLAATAPAHPVARRRRLRLHVAALAALGAGVLVALPLQAAIAADVPVLQAFGAPLIQVLTETRYGLVWAGRAAILALLAALIAWMIRRPATPRWATWATIALGLALLVTTSLTSHGAALREGVALAVAADWLHLVATAAWLGGLAHLLLAVPPAVAACPPAVRAPLLAAVVGRFSTLALAGVGLLLLSGGLGALLYIDRVEALWTTDYGRALASKLLLLLPMLALGALNLLWVRPALQRAVAHGITLSVRLAAVARAGRALVRSVRLELLFGVLILAATGVLTSVPPARGAVPAVPGLARTEAAGDLRLALRITPGQPGDNTIELTATRDGQPAEGVSRALVRLTYLEQELGETEVVLAPVGDGRYAARGRQLALVGEWQAELIVRREGQDDARTAVRFPIPAGMAAGADPAGGPAPVLPRLTPAGTIALVGLALAATFGLGALRLRRSVALAGGLLGAGAGALALAVYLFATGGLASAVDTAAGRNPFPPTAQSLAHGKTLYTANCQACHGVAGKGDGPAGRGLNPPPLDLSVHVGQHSDGELFRMVSRGVPGTAMVPFAGRLTDEERWHLVNYIRTFDAYQQAGQRAGGGSP